MKHCGLARVSLLKRNGEGMYTRKKQMIASNQLTTARTPLVLGLQLKQFQFRPLRAALTASFDHEAFGCNQGLNNNTRSGSARRRVPHRLLCLLLALPRARRRRLLASPQRLTL